MKTIKILICLCLLSITAIAQEGIKTNRVSHLAKKLGVSEKKAQDIVAALELNRSSIRQTVLDTTLRAAERFKRIEKLKEERARKMSTLLTAVQLTVLTADSNVRLKVMREQRLEKLRKEKEIIQKKFQQGSIDTLKMN